MMHHVREKVAVRIHHGRPPIGILVVEADADTKIVELGLLQVEIDGRGYRAVAKGIEGDSPVPFVHQGRAVKRAVIDGEVEGP